MTRPLAIVPVRDDGVGDFGARVVDDRTGDEVHFYGWQPTLHEALDEALDAYPDATVLDPSWDTRCDHDGCQAPLTLGELEPDGLGRVICDKCRALEAREEARGVA